MSQASSTWQSVRSELVSTGRLDEMRVKKARDEMEKALAAETFREYATEAVLYDVARERERQVAKWGTQHHPDGTGGTFYQQKAGFYKTVNDNAVEDGTPAWDRILLEEVYEALSETNQSRLREELVQVAAVCTSWVEDLDSRKTTDAA